MLRTHRSFQGMAARLGMVSAAVLLLAACAETQLAAHTAKRVTGSVSIPVTGSYKIGNPYQIDGTWYYPKEDFSYRENGVASWYGPDFHGKATANGEVYDMNDLTAAHRTLPLPSIVRVTNLDNNRSLILRVNDRGPFAKNRIIDVSRRGAQLLGFEAKGTTQVRVEILREESIALRDAILGGRGGSVMVASAETPGTTMVETAPVVAAPVVQAPPPPRPVVMAPVPEVRVETTPVAPPSRVVAEPERPAVISVPPQSQVVASAAPVATAGGGDAWIQAGAFSSLQNARRLEAQLQGFGGTVVAPVDSAGGTLYRVRIGPMADAGRAQQVLDQVRAAGFGNAVVVMD